MPKTPDITTMAGNSAEILNAIRNEIGGSYADTVPEVLPENTETLHEAGKAILDYTPNRNAFLSVLYNRIGRVLITSKFYSNPWAMFKKGLLEYGETVEEIFVELARVQSFDPEQAENTVFRRVKPDVRATFHTMNYQKFYKTTVSEAQLRQAFLSFEGVTDLITRIVDAIYTSANYDEFLVMKYMVARAILNGGVYPITIPAATKENASDIVTEVKAISNELTFMRQDYNLANVHTYTDKADQIVLINARFDAVMDVNVLASAFNIDYVQFMGQRVLFDSIAPTDSVRLAEIFDGDPNYTPLTDAEIEVVNSVPLIILDRDWFMIFDNFINTNDIYNPEGLYTNFFLHTWKTFSTSPYKNAIALTELASAVTGVTVTPATATVAPGGVLQLSANVSGTGINIDKVYWTLDNEAAASLNPYTGLFTASADITDITEVVVTATSVTDGTKSATATITINP